MGDVPQEDREEEMDYDEDEEVRKKGGKDKKEGKEYEMRRKKTRMRTKRRMIGRKLLPASGSSSLLSPENSSSPTKSSRESSKVALSYRQLVKGEGRYDGWNKKGMPSLHLQKIIKNEICLFVGMPSVCLSVCLFVCLSVCLSIRMSPCVPLRQTVLTLTSTVTMKKLSSLSLLYGVSILLVRHKIFPLRVRERSAEHSLLDSNLSNNIPANSLMSFCSTRLMGVPS